MLAMTEDNKKVGTSQNDAKEKSAIFWLNVDYIYVYSS